MGDRAEDEIANGRLWRAKETLRGRVADAGYDPALFERLAHVLADMHDDDEAGRYYLLAGCRDGAGGRLARAFLARRAASTFAGLWSQMPAAASRTSVSTPPAGTMEMLAEAGFDQRQVGKHLTDLRQRGKANTARRKKARAGRSDLIRGERIGLAMAAILLVVLTVGIVGTMRLLWWGFAKLLGLG